jgi:hypothetical protein
MSAQDKSSRQYLETISYTHIAFGVVVSGITGYLYYTQRKRENAGGKPFPLAFALALIIMSLVGIIYYIAVLIRGEDIIQDIFDEDYHIGEVFNNKVVCDDIDQIYYERADGRLQNMDVNNPLSDEDLRMAEIYHLLN